MSAKTKKTTEETAPEPKPAKGSAKASKATAKSVKPSAPEKTAKDNAAGEKPAKEAHASDKPAKKEKAAAPAHPSPETPPRDGPRGRSAHAKQYRPEDRYKVGDVLYHPVWQEEGTVIEVGKTPGDIDKIVVEFDRLGTKRLVANYSASTAGSDD